MSPSEPTKPVTSTANGKSNIRKPYQKPEVRHERVFETMALSCGKVQATSASCRLNRKTS
jgi:hypothetical protein